MQVSCVRTNWQQRGFSCALWTDPPGQVWADFVHPDDERLLPGDWRSKEVGRLSIPHWNLPYMIEILLPAGRAAIDLALFVLLPVMVVMLSLMRLLEAKGLLDWVVARLTGLVRPFGLVLPTVVKYLAGGGGDRRPDARPCIVHVTGSPPFSTFSLSRTH